ncbi:MAG: hypothetical protein IJV00_00885 [Clostridia bacterium]|nr:hypothetical protein [Clostridia bacterium]
MKDFAKRAISVFLSLILLSGIIPLSAVEVFANAPESDFTDTVENGEATITKYNGSGGDVVIPSTLGGYPVTSIGNAFRYCTSLSRLSFPTA